MMLATCRPWTSPAPLRAISGWSARLRIGLSSKNAFLQYVRTEGNAHGGHSWTNEDLKPSPPHMVNWRWYNFCLFWFGMGFGNWYVRIGHRQCRKITHALTLIRTLGSSIVGAGLTWWQATIVVWIGAGVSGTCMALNSRAAANYHIGYPVILRTCFGMYGHYWPVISRGACAMLWVAVLSKSNAYDISLVRRQSTHNL